MDIYPSTYINYINFENDKTQMIPYNIDRFGLLKRKDMDVNEHERLSNITLRKTQIKVKDQRFYCCSTFQSH